MGLLRGLIASFWLFFFISVASVYFFPHPQKLDGMAPKVSFYSSVLWSILGLKDSYNVDYFGQLYSQSSNQTYPQAQPNKQPYSMKPLPSIDASDKDWEKKFHDIFIKQDHAVVVRGLQKNSKYFPGAKNWSLKNIAKSFGNKKIPVFKDHLKDKSAVLESFDEYLENLHKEDYKGYARCLDYPDDSIDVAYNREKILELMNMEFGERFTHAVNNGKTPGCIFVGNSKLNTNMHCDIGTSAFLMIEGQKRWIFFPPSESMYLFPMPHQFNVAYNTIMDIFNFNSTNLAKYPMLHLAKGFEVILNPGDVLFFPSMWWHAVQNLGITYGIDLPIFDPIMSIKRNPLLSFGTLFNLRAAYHLALSALSGKAGGKSLFFKGYMVEDDEATNLGQEKKN